MSKGDELHQLIQSMELNEKRYFKLQSSLQKKNSNLTQLFDFLSNAQQYDEEEVRTQFAKEKFLDQLAVTQNHLYELILRAMRAYHLKRSIDFKLQGMMQDVQFLFEKGLKSQAEAVLRRLRKVAMKHDSFLIMLQVVEYETKLIAEGFFVGKDETDIETLSEQYYEVLGLLQNEREYMDLQFKVFNNYYKIGVERKNEAYKTNDQIINQFALRHYDKALTYRSRIAFLNIHAQYNKINGRWEEAYRYRRQMLDLVSERFGASFESDATKRYFVAINNLVPICMKLGRYDEVAQLLNELDTIEERSLATHYSVELGQRIWMQGMIGRLALYTRLGLASEGLELAANISERIVEVQNYPRRYVVMHLYFNLAYFLFSIGQFSEALRYANLILNDDDIRDIEDLHASTRLLAMMLQYELGRSELLEYLVRAARRYLVKLEGLYPFESILLAFLRRASSLVDADVKTEFTNLRKQLVAVGYEPGDRNALSTLDLLSWVDSKLEGRPLTDILKEKNERKRTA
ncbi:MAG: hypothetical protein K9J06_08000 [Flavobacteriales bacterium]|nr:hypothetical protein [Flavobacteriales bacterium]